LNSEDLVKIQAMICPNFRDGGIAGIIIGVALSGRGGGDMGKCV